MEFLVADEFFLLEIRECCLCRLLTAKFHSGGGVTRVAASHTGLF